MRQYQPPFDDPYVIEVARRRNILGPDESFAEGIERVAHALATKDADITGVFDRAFRSGLNEAMSTGKLFPSSQMFSAAGRSTTVAACTVLRLDGLCDPARIRSFIAQAVAASREGMGAGIDVSDVDDPVQAVFEINAAMRQMHLALEAQQLRPPALMVTCDDSHPRIIEFINAKSNADFNEFVANISVKIGRDNARWERLLPSIAASAHWNGEPGVIFQAAADHDNPTPEYPLRSTAPCAEAIMAENEKCVFMSINVDAHVTGGCFSLEKFAASVRLAVRAADAAVELAAEGADMIVGRRRRIGIGVCGFHSALIDLGIPYASSVEFADVLSETLLFAAHIASAILARERGPFPAWSGSRWRDPAWIERKASKRRGAIAQNEWAHLARLVLENGVRNATIVAFPPTGVVSEMLGVSKSYEPHFTLVGRARASASTAIRLIPEIEAIIGSLGGESARESILHPASGHQLPGIDPAHLVACARQLPPSVHLAIHSAFCSLADEAGSKTVNMPHDAGIDEVAWLFEEARRLGLKGLTVFRDGCLDRAARIPQDNEEAA